MSTVLVINTAPTTTVLAVSSLPAVIRASDVTSVAGRTGAVTLGVADVVGSAPLAAPTFTGSITLPNWTTANRPSPASAGMVGWNTDLLRYDHCVASGTTGTWAQFTRLNGDTMTAPLLINSGGSGNAARIQGAASGSAVALGADPTSVDTNVGVAVTPKGTGSLTARIPDGTSQGGNARGANAVDFQTVRATAAQVASGSQAVLLGGSFNSASGANSVVVGGDSNSASGVRATIGGGGANLADATYGTIPGGFYGSTRGTYGKFAFASGRTALVGDAQLGEHVLRRQTTDATATVLTSDGGGPGAANQVILPNNSSFTGRVIVTAKCAGFSEAAAWTLDFAAIRAGAANTIVLYQGAASAIVPTSSFGLGSNWRITLAADSTNGGLAITVTGEAGKTISWVARVSTTEVVA